MATLAVQGSVVAALAEPLEGKQVDAYRSEPFDANEVTKGLFLSDIASAFHVDRLKELGITHVLSLVPIKTAAFPEQFVYKSLPVLDVMEEDMIAVFDEAFAFIDEARSKDKAVLVHCMSGVSRSATVVTAYIMKKFGFNLRTALEMVQSALPKVRPNAGFMFQLQLFEDMGCRVQGNSKAHRTYRQRVRRSPRTSPDVDHFPKPPSPYSATSDSVARASVTNVSPVAVALSVLSAVTSCADTSSSSLASSSLGDRPRFMLRAVPVSAYAGRTCVAQ